MSSNGKQSILKRIASPRDLRKLNVKELDILASEIRSFLIQTVSKTGGHLGSNLGSVELTLVMHYVFNTPTDLIVWDVGCQAYTHKIVTGRAKTFHTNRQYGGVAGFPRRDESEYDTFGVGHASTSISAALGMAEARDLQSNDQKILAVIGDGGMTGGLAFEGLNNAGASNKDITVVFNDNSWAISRNVGALSNMFSNIRTDPLFERIKDNLWELAGHIPSGKRIRKALHGMDEGLRGMLLPGMWFERLGFRYVGPINGHDTAEMISMFKWVKTIEGPVIVHVLTEKGKGYALAETDLTHLHGVSKFDPVIGPQKKLKTFEELNYCQHFSEELEKIAAKDRNIVAITPAMIEGSDLGRFQQKYPNRCYDVGIAEGHALTFAAGLATQKLRPVVAIYSTFLQRAYDQLIHDIALQKLPVVLGIDRAGLVGEDGPTHHGAFDISYIRHIPDVRFLAPRDGKQTRLMLRESLKIKDAPVCIRFPRGAAPVFDEPEQPNENIWEPELMINGSKNIIISVGPLLKTCCDVADQIRETRKKSIGVMDFRCIKPIPEDYLLKIAAEYKRWLIVEENVLAGGLGSLLLEFLNEHEIDNVKVKRMGLPDGFVTHGNREILLRDVGLDPESIFEAASSFFGCSSKSTTVSKILGKVEV